MATFRLQILLWLTVWTGNELSMSRMSSRAHCVQCAVFLEINRDWNIVPRTWRCETYEKSTEPKLPQPNHFKEKDASSGLCSFWEQCQRRLLNYLFIWYKHYYWYWTNQMHCFKRYSNSLELRWFRAAQWGQVHQVHVLFSFVLRPLYLWINGICNESIMRSLDECYQEKSDMDPI